MGERSAIEWTDATWNPVRARNRVNGRIGWHCERVSEGCRNCYAESLNRWRGNGLAYAASQREFVDIILDETTLLQPLRWRRPRMIFAGSMTDLFADFVPDAMLDRIFAVMVAAHWHTFQLLTKRPQRMRRYLSNPALPIRLASAWCNVGRNLRPGHAGWSQNAWRADGVLTVPRSWPLRNIWLGTSCEDQDTADARVPELLATPAAVWFLSAEPLLGPIRIDKSWTIGRLARINQIIVGGESGPHARPMHPEWARSLRDQCAAAGVAFYFKQHGEWIGVPDLRYLPGGGGPDFGAYDHHRHDLDADSVRVGKRRAGRRLDGVEHNDMPRLSA